MHTKNEGQLIVEVNHVELEIMGCREDEEFRKKQLHVPVACQPMR